MVNDQSIALRLTGRPSLEKRKRGEEWKEGKFRWRRGQIWTEKEDEMSVAEFESN